MFYLSRKSRLVLCDHCEGTGFIKSGWSEAFLKLEARVYGEKLKEDPYLLVVHSGAKGRNVAKFIHENRNKKYASYHVAWSENLQEFVQCVPFNRRAYHVKGSLGVFEGRKHVNGFSIGIALPGPYDQEFPDYVKEKFIRAVSDILIEVPTLKIVVRHKDIQKNKKDPGMGFMWNWLDSFSRFSLPFDFRRKAN